MPDDARTVAFDERAPADERNDAQAVLQKSYRALNSELVPSAELAPLINMIRDDLVEGEMLAKAQPLNRLPAEHDARKPGQRGMQSVYLDNLQLFVSGEYYEKPSPMGFEGLRQMVEAMPILNSIIMTRQRQVSRFCGMSEDGGQGFEIRHQDREHELTADEKKSTALLSRFMANGGWEWNPRARKRMKRDTLSQFMAKSVRDTLTFDACPIETEFKRDRRLGIDGFYAVDGSTIRLCTEQGYAGDDEVVALQVVQGRIMTAYTVDDLVYEVRNPRTDVRLAGYGMGETELLIKVVTGLLNAMTYNISGFDQNSIPKGLLSLTGTYAQEDLVAFRRYWNATVKGINNAWTLPVMTSPDEGSKVEFTPFNVDFNEMHFSRWMTFLVSVACAVYGMSPAEINFDSFSAGTSSLSGSDTEEKLASSKDLGLHPLMSFYENLFTDFLIAEFNPAYCFRWVGLKPEDEAQRWEARKMILSVDELRAEEGYQPFADPKIGSLPINPTLIGPAMQLSQAPEPGQDFGGQPAEAGPDYGDPGADDGEEGGFPPAGGAEDQGQPPGQGEAQSPPGDFGAAPAGGDFGKAFRELTFYAAGS